MSDTLKALGEGSVPTRRYIDLVTPHVQDNRTSEEIITQMRLKLAEMADEDG